MKVKTKISVILPVYNVEPYIGCCIESLKAQTLSEIEFIFVDDCSIDRSMEPVKTWAEQDSRVLILQNENNMGAGYSRNRGIEAASGDYLTFTDPDDYVSPDFYELLYTAATAGGGHDIAKGLRRKVDDVTGKVAQPDKKLNDNIRSCLAEGRPLYVAFTYEHLTAIYRHELFFRVGARYGTTRNSEDITFLLRYCYHTNDIVFEESAIYFYMQRVGSIAHGDPVKIANGQAEAMVERIEFLKEMGIDDTSLQYILNRANDCISRLKKAIRDGRARLEDYKVIAARIAEIVGPIPGALKASGAWPELRKILLDYNRRAGGGLSIRNGTIGKILRLVWRKERRKQENTKSVGKVYMNSLVNAGDRFINDLLILLNSDMKPTGNPAVADLVTLGGILSSLQKHKKTVSTKPLYVWGTGFLLGDDVHDPLCRTNIIVKALRGKLSKDKLEGLLGISLPDDLPLADPGLLASYFTTPNVRKKYSVGFIPHYRELGTDEVKRVLSSNPDMHFIDITMSPREVIWDIQQCETIVSSSLHGLVFSDSMGIPNVHVRLTELPVGGSFKFRDYYSSFNLEDPALTERDIYGITDKEIKNQYSVDQKEVEEKKRQLLESFPDVFRR